MNRLNIKLEEMNYNMREELKTLRTNLMFCGVDKKVIMITSTVPGEGKTHKSICLAASLAEINKKVLLLDLDLRKSVMASRLNSQGTEYGLSHFLSGQCQLSDLIYATNVPRLHIALAGSSVPNPTELLSGERFHKLIESLRAVYDYIIIDNAPLGLVIDAAIVAKECDGAMIVVEAGAIKYRQVQEVKRKIEQADCPVLGVILSKVNYGSAKYSYGKYGKYGKYEVYGAYGEEE